VPLAMLIFQGILQELFTRSVSGSFVSIDVLGAEFIRVPSMIYGGSPPSAEVKVARTRTVFFSRLSYFRISLVVCSIESNSIFFLIFRTSLEALQNEIGISRLTGHLLTSFRIWGASVVNMEL